MTIKTIAVIGAGTMGNGIAHTFALNGFDVVLIDVKQAQLDQAFQTISKNMDRQVSKDSITADEKVQALGRIILETSLAAGVEHADLVVEAATENTDIKLSLFKQIDLLAPPQTILASNTSSISISKIGAATNRPDKVIGMHFMNPVPVMKLVEIINGKKTDAEVTNIIVELSKQIGKTPCVVNDYPGFIANRILMPMINEAIYSLYEGVAGVEEIDTIMKLGMGHPLGPLQLADLIGLDVCLSILKVLEEGFQMPKYAPCPLLVELVDSGQLGIKSGEGFYVYNKTNKESKVSPRFL